MTNWKDIFKKERELSQEELLRYLNKDISEEEMNSIEQELTASDFENDAIEGLEQFKNKETIVEITNSLNQQLKKHISRNTKRKKKRKLQDQQWLIVAILAVLLLSVAGYLLIHYNH